MTGFRWNDWNLQHATKHGCRLDEIESVVRTEMRRGAVEDCGNEKLRVQGRGRGDRMMEVIFVFDADEASAMFDDTVYVIHAMPLTTRRRRNSR